MSQDSDEPTNQDDAGKNAAKKPQGFGRKPQFDDKLRREVVLAWLNRDQSLSMKLDEFLVQKLGTYPDGTPQVIPATFYGWIRKIRGEMDKKE